MNAAANPQGAVTLCRTTQKTTTIVFSRTLKIVHSAPQRRIGSKALAALGAAILCMFVSVSAVSQSSLPSMGEPADSALSPLEEAAIGRQLMRQIRAQLPLALDTQVDEYINTLGQLLVQASGRQKTNFTFFVVEDPNINAFAFPGGYIGVNQGLIEAMVFEDQLAGVVAHEIAHVTQRHHARMFAVSKTRTLRTAATIVAAILVAAASPEAGQAALAAGLAVNQQSAINFTRLNEIEADRIGIDILDSAEFDPTAMAESFAILQRKNRLNTSGLQLEYLRTHPLDNNRIAEASNRAANLITRKRDEQLDFNLIKARLRVLTTQDVAQQLSQEKANWRRHASPSSAYALTLLNLRSKRLNEAQRWMRELTKIAADHPAVLLIGTELKAAQGRKGESTKQLKTLHTLYPERYSILEMLLDQLIDARQLTEARQLANNYIRRSDRPNRRAYRTMASIQQQLGETAASHESLAYYFAELDEYQRAASQLELALAHVATGSQDELRLRASLDVVRGNSPR